MCLQALGHQKNRSLSHLSLIPLSSWSLHNGRYNFLKVNYVSNFLPSFVSMISMDIMIKSIKKLLTNYVYKKRRGGTPKSGLFLNVYKVESVNIRWLVVKTAKTYHHNLWTTQKLLWTPKAWRAPEERGLPYCVIILVACTLIWTWKFILEILWVQQDLGCTICGSMCQVSIWQLNSIIEKGLHFFFSIRCLKKATVLAQTMVATIIISWRFWL